MPPGVRICILLIVLSAMLGFPASGAGQSSADSTDQSTIFPLLAAKEKAAKEKRDAGALPEADIRQTSPVRQTVFEQSASAPEMIGAPRPTTEPSQSQLGGQSESCPDCGRPLEHPILGTCDSCQGPGRRLLNLLCPWKPFSDRPGSPVYHEPWINRPFSVGVFVGPMVGSPLIDDWVGQQTGTLAGLRLGWDMGDDWGMEMRFATANTPLYDSEAAIAAQQNISGLPLPSPYGTRNSDQFLWDIDFLYYPWGDDSFRPYLLFGLGTDRIKFTDRLGTNYARILLGMPVGLGVKTRLNDWLIFRMECTDNMAFAGGSIFQSQHNISLTGAFEVRLGRTKIQYWPWNPGR
jgi:hypothetical protein